LGYKDSDANVTRSSYITFNFQPLTPNLVGMDIAITI
jgi:hypothetical protein